MGRRILLVDDNSDLTSMLRQLLEHDGHAVEVVNDSTDALDTARRFGPDLVLLDLGMPGRDGYEVARELRSDPELKDTELVALTGYGSDELMARSHAAGFDGHVTKPLARTRLHRLLQDHPPRG